MNALSLFSGIGGLDLAAESAGIRIIAMCEKDKFCRDVLRKRWPDVPVFEDVFDLHGIEGGIDINGTATPVELVYGGFPCQ
jgi:DNA (cytosine-5)-methyltransferase 1